MKVYRILLSFVIPMAFMTASFSFAAGGIQWLSLQEGMERARAEKKPMIVDFYFGKGCHRCEKLQRDVYDDSAIARKIRRDFIPIRIDLTKELTAEEKRLGEQYDYKHDCLLVFLKPDGTLLKDTWGTRLCFVNAVDPETFIEYLDQIKAGTIR